MSGPKIILLEFNEITYNLIQPWIQQGKLPFFQKFFNESEIFVTDAEAEGDMLNPWVQWVTLHTGLPHHAHKISKLNQKPPTHIDTIFDIVSDHNLSSWICGSMNAFTRTSIKGKRLSDPWSTEIQDLPEEEFIACTKFIRHAIHQHAKDSPKFETRDIIQFFKFMLGHGLSLNTCFLATKQLTQELFGDKKYSRSYVLDYLLFDLFKHQWQRLQPNVATFFSNSTAHSMHSYWQHMQPDLFATTSQTFNKNYQNVILQSYQNHDALLQKFMDWSAQDTVLILCSALSQQPYFKAENTGGKYTYLPINSNIFSNVLGITQPYTFEPVMSEQGYLRFQSQADATEAAQILLSYKTTDTQENAFKAQLTAGNSLFFSCRLHQKNDVRPLYTSMFNRTIKLSDAFYSPDYKKSGCHHPDGLLWVRKPSKNHHIHTQKISLRSITPSILQMLNIQPKEHMLEPVF